MHSKEHKNMKSTIAFLFTTAVLNISISSCNSNSSPSEVVDNISTEIQEKVESTTNAIKENNIYNQCFSLSDITIYKGEASIRVEPNEDLILQKIIKNEGEKIVLTNLKITINDKYTYTATPEETLNYICRTYDFAGSKKLGIDYGFLGNSSLILNGSLADENGNRFNYYDTKVLNIKFSCDQFSLERDYN
jgi:hypothetical protein